MDETSQLLHRKLPGMRRDCDRARTLQYRRLTPCTVLPFASLNSVFIPKFGSRGSTPGLPVFSANVSASPAQTSLPDSGPE